MVGIPYVNQPDLLRSCINSIKLFHPNVVIIDNSPTRELSKHEDIDSVVQVLFPEKPLSFTQSMNAFHQLAHEQNCDVLFYMHSDAEAEEGTPEKLLQCIEDYNNEGRKWGVLYTHYDILAAYNMSMVRDVGFMDETFTSYFSDNDWYYRAKLLGYELITTGLPIVHHCSSTIKGDAQMKKDVHSQWMLWHIYYMIKWGGEPDYEIFTEPFNGGNSNLQLNIDLESFANINRLIERKRLVNNES